MTPSVELRDVLILLTTAILVVSIFRHLRTSAVLGYLVAGALVGPHGLGLLQAQGVTVLAEFGVVFLLFAIGLELSLERLASLRRYLGLGASEVVVTTLVLWAAIRATGIKTSPSLILASGLRSPLPPSYCRCWSSAGRWAPARDEPPLAYSCCRIWPSFRFSP
jgi:CPA2 family monovalent cation:H+ antiporter-2